MIHIYPVTTLGGSSSELLTDFHLLGAAVLAHSLRDAGTTKKLAALVTLDTLSADTITELKVGRHCTHKTSTDLYVLGLV